MGYKFIQRPGSEISFFPMANRYLVTFGLAGAYNQHIRYLFQLRLPDLIADLFVALITVGPERNRTQCGADVGGIGMLPLSNRNNYNLLRASQAGKAPAYCSISRAKKRSMAP